MERRVAAVLLGLLALSVAVFASEDAAEPEDVESLPSDVLVLEVSNFTETVEKHDFIVVEFYAPWCGHCKKLAPEWDKAAALLKSNDPPIILAKVDVNEEHNKPLASEFDIKGFPTLKVIKNKGRSVQDYKGPREADGIVSYLLKLAGPPSLELTSADQTQKFLSDNEKNLALIGLFEKLEGEEYVNFLTVADNLRGDYEFAHTLSGAHLPDDGVSLKTPSVRLYKNFDDKFLDFHDFSVEALTKFLDDSSLPLVTEMSKNPEHRPALMKFFESPMDKVFLFLGEDEEGEDTQKDILKAFSDLAKKNKEQGLISLFSYAEESANALQYFGLEKSDLPAAVIQDNKGKKYIAPNVNVQKLAPWIADYLLGVLKETIKSEPIPETNDEPVKVIVANSLKQAVLESEKDVFLEFYAPWCGHCKKLVPILDEVAVAFKDDPHVVIAKFDATANDVPSDLFDVQGFPTLYFRSAKGVITPYDGERTKEDIISFINKNRSTPAHPEDKTSAGEEVIETIREVVESTKETVQPPEDSPVKDEL